MKSGEIKTEEDINKHIGELELKKLKDVSRHAQRHFINNITTLSTLFVIVLLGSLYPSIREPIVRQGTEFLQNLAYWYLALPVLVLLIIRRIIRYRIE